MEVPFGLDKPLVVGEVAGGLMISAKGESFFSEKVLHHVQVILNYEYKIILVLWVNNFTLKSRVIEISNIKVCFGSASYGQSIADASSLLSFYFVGISICAFI